MNKYEGNKVTPWQEVRKNIPIFKERVQRYQDIGREFQNRIGEQAESTLPPVFDRDPNNRLAVFSTNEGVDRQILRTIQKNKPTGYITGAGFGNILRGLEGFNQGWKRSVPLAIVSTDVMPEVVLGARHGSEEAKRAKDGDFDGFWEKLTQPSRETLEEVVAQERNPLVQERLRAAIDFTIRELDMIPLRNRYYERAIKDVLRDNFRVFQQLAREGNIGVTLADMTNPVWVHAVSELPEFSTRRNIIYMSNTIDHITKRGADLSKINALDVLKVLGEGKQRGNTYLDTTQIGAGYILRVGNSVPHYTKADFRKEKHW